MPRITIAAGNSSSQPFSQSKSWLAGVFGCIAATASTIAMNESMPPKMRSHSQRETLRR